MTSSERARTSEKDAPRGAATADTSRIIAFSDGVIAIILTIMIFNLQPPKAEGWAALDQMGHTLVAYVLSYMFVAVCWVNHHHLLRYPTHTSSGLLWSNFAFLFTMSFLPVSTSYLTIEQFSRFSIQVYALTFMPMLAAYMVLETFVMLNLREDHVRVEWYSLAMIRGAVALIVHGSAAAVAMKSPQAAFALILTNTLLYICPECVTASNLLGRRTGGRPRRGADDGLSGEPQDHGCGSDHHLHEPKRGASLD